MRLRTILWTMETGTGPPLLRYAKPSARAIFAISFSKYFPAAYCSNLRLRSRARLPRMFHTN
jgi:hypothetical protein